MFKLPKFLNFKRERVLPNSLSVDDFGKDHRVMQVNIFFNGQKQDGCIAFNVKEGWIKRYKKRAGRIVIENGELVTETIKGVVEVTWIEDDK